MAEARTLEEIKLDNAYKFGAGRYIQQRQALETVAEEVGRLGKSRSLLRAREPGKPQRAGSRGR